MERKRKLPPRAAARSEQAAKKRNVTSRERSATPASAAVAPEPEAPSLPPPLPRSIQAGKPLPTVEDAQPEDLSLKEYQTVGESGVLAESLARSRHRWISDGLFEKYWTKPHKRKGVVNEDPKNPPKDSMTKVGTITITIEPHVIEATMFAVKESKLRSQQQQQSQQQTRPILQYGPPNGSMPPPPTPKSASATPTQAAVPVASKPNVSSPAPVKTLPSPRPPQAHPQPTPPATENVKPAVQPIVNNVTPSRSPSLTPRPSTAAGPASSATPPQSTRTPSNPPSNVMPSTPGSKPPVSTTPVSAPAPAASPAPMPASKPPAPGTPVASVAAAPKAAHSTSAMTTAAPRLPIQPNATPTTGLSKPSTPSTGATSTTAKPAANDPVIALLAQKASGDPELRDLMKRVAMGQAKDGELAHFQTIIDQLNAEYKSKGGQQGPSADRLLVDGRTVKYFADEVRTILDIVLASNPNQKSTELRPPPRSDPLVVLLVKTALEDNKTKETIKRIAEGRPGFTDATDLKEILDKLHREMKAVPHPSPVAQSKQANVNSMTNGHVRTPSSQTTTPSNPQALRSKGPLPVHKPDISAVVFDFGTGDRYLFPKYSMLQYLPTGSGQQVIASFLIVRKGSTSEYGGDPELDYYQPVTIRLYTHNGRHLENLSRVVAPQDEVRRYMNDVMDNMTRAEYVLLAMQLPRTSNSVEHNGGAAEEHKANGSTPKMDGVLEHTYATKPGVLWTTASRSGTPASERPSSKQIRNPEDEGQARYQRLIQSVAAKDAE